MYVPEHIVPFRGRERFSNTKGPFFHDQADMIIPQDTQNVTPPFSDKETGEQLAVFGLV